MKKRLGSGCCPTFGRVSHSGNRGSGFSCQSGDEPVRWETTCHSPWKTSCSSLLSCLRINSLSDSLGDSFSSTLRSSIRSQVVLPCMMLSLEEGTSPARVGPLTLSFRKTGSAVFGIPVGGDPTGMSGTRQKAIVVPAIFSGADVFGIAVQFTRARSV